MMEFRDFVRDIFNDCAALQLIKKDLTDLQRLKCVARFARSEFNIPKKYLNKKGIGNLVKLLNLHFPGNKRLRLLYGNNANFPRHFINNMTHDKIYQLLQDPIIKILW